MAAGRQALRQTAYSGVEASGPGDTASEKGFYLSQFPRGGAMGKTPGKSRGRGARGKHGKSLHCGFCGKGRARQGNQAQEQHHWLWDVGPQPSATRLVALSMAAR